MAPIYYTPPVHELREVWLRLLPVAFQADLASGTCKKTGNDAIVTAVLALGFFNNNAILMKIIFETCQKSEEIGHFQKLFFYALCIACSFCAAGPALYLDHKFNGCAKPNEHAKRLTVAYVVLTPILAGFDLLWLCLKPFVRGLKEKWLAKNISRITDQDDQSNRTQWQVDTSANDTHEGSEGRPTVPGDISVPSHYTTGTLSTTKSQDERWRLEHERRLRERAQAPPSITAGPSSEGVAGQKPTVVDTSTVPSTMELEGAAAEVTHGDRADGEGVDSAAGADGVEHEAANDEEASPISSLKRVVSSGLIYSLKRVVSGLNWFLNLKF